MYKRIIPSVLIQNGNAVKGKQFNSSRQACDVISYIKTLSHKNADEICLINLDRNLCSTTLSILELIMNNVSCPLSYSGGIRTKNDISILSSLGVDRFIIGSLAYKPTNNIILEEIFNLVGSAALSVSVDILEEDNKFYQLNHDNSSFIEIDLLDHINNLINIGFSEIILTSINNDGMMNGLPSYFENLVTSINNFRKLVLAGGIGKVDDICKWLKYDSVSALMIGSALIYSKLTISDYHNHGIKNKINLRPLRD